MDLTMCIGGSCPKKSQCLRYRKFPAAIQSYFSPPLSQGDGKTCEYFMPFNEFTARVRPMRQIKDLP